jgi:hypothetical protein
MKYLRNQQTENIKSHKPVTYQPIVEGLGIINRLTPELIPSAQRCLTRFLPGDFAS